jgi:hypothetical protein
MGLGVGGETVARIRAVVDVDTSGLQRGVKDAEQHTSRLGSALGTTLKAGAIAAAVGIGVATVALEKSVKAAVEWQTVNARMKTGLKDAGLSWGKYHDQIDGTLTKMTEASGFMRSDLADSFTNMVRTTGNVTKAFQDLQLAEDLARTKGISLATAQSMVARVANGSYTSLKKLGIAITPVTAAQDALARAHDKATKSGTKFNVQMDAEYRNEQRAAKAADKHRTSINALDLMQKKFGGQSAAYAKTAAGQWDIFHADLEVLEEDIGSRVLPALTGLAKHLTGIFDAKDWTARIHLAIAGGEGAAKSIYNDFHRALFGYFSRTPIKVDGGKIIGFNTNSSSGLVASLEKSFDGMNWKGIGTKILNGIESAFASGNSAINGMVTSLVKAMTSSQNLSLFAGAGVVIAVTMINDLMSPSFWMAHWKLLLDLLITIGLTFFGDGMGKIAEIGGKSLVDTLFKIMPEGFARILDTMLTKGAQFGGKFADFVKTKFMDGVDALPSVISRVIGRMLTLLGSAGDAIPGLFRAAWSKLTNGASLAAGDAEKAIASKIGGAITGIIGSVGKFAAKFTIVNAAITGIQTIAHDIRTVFDDVKNAIGSISWPSPPAWLNTIISDGGSALSKIGLAGGGRVTGGIPGKDSVPALLTPGEVVLNAGQQRSVSAALGAPLSHVLGFAHGGLVPPGKRKKESAGAYRGRVSNWLTNQVDNRFNGLDFGLQLADRVAQRDDSEGNYTGEIAQLQKEQRIRGKEMKLYAEGARVARRFGLGSIATGFRQSAAMIHQDVLDTADTIKGLRHQGTAAGGGGLSAADVASQIASFLTDFRGIQEQYSGGAAAGAAAAAGVTVHLHGVSSVDSDPTAALRQAQFAAQAVFGA